MSAEGKISFKGIEEASERTMTRPGTIAVFDVEKVVFGSTTNKGTYYMGVTFGRKEDSFSHSFFLSPKALPRVKSLCKQAGKALGDDDELSEAQFIALLEGKKLAMKVTAKFDDSNGRAYPDLPFGGFAKPAGEIAQLSFSDKEQADINRANTMVASASSTGADGASASTKTSGASSGAPAPSVAGATDDLPF